MQNKKSIRFYKDHEVRAIWDEEKSLWWFSIVDIVGAITDSPSPRKYWSVLKTRLKKAGNELTTRCSQLKMTAADGKQYATDCFAQDDIIQIVRVIPSKKKADKKIFRYSLMPPQPHCARNELHQARAFRLPRKVIGGERSNSF